MTITLKDAANPRIVISDNGNNVLIGSDISSITTGINITTLGISAGSSITTANNIIAIGKTSLPANTVQDSQISIGNQALQSLNDSVGDSRFNVAIGHQALATAALNVTKCFGIGQAALFALNQSSNIVAIGHNAGVSLTTSNNNNVLIGTDAGTGCVSANSATFIGDSATSSGAFTNCMALGANVTIGASNAVNIGAACYVGISNSTPAYSLDLSPISNVAAVRIDNSSIAPSTPSSGSLLYTRSGIPTYMNTNAVERAIPHRTSVTVSGTSKTFALTDTDTFQVCTNGATVTLTVPTNASVAFPVDTEIDVFQQGAGQVVFAAAGGVTIQSMFSNLKIAAQYSGATLKKVGTDTWALTGNLTA